MQNLSKALKPKDCSQIISAAAEGLLQAETRKLEDLGLGVVLSLIKESLGRLGIDFDIEDIDELRNLLLNAPELILAHFEYEGDIVYAFLKQLSVNRVVVGLALIYISAVELKASLEGYSKALEDLLKAINKWELETKKKGAAEVAYKTLADARKELETALEYVNYSITADDLEKSMSYLRGAQGHIEVAQNAICASPAGDTMPSLSVFMKVQLALITARISFAVAIQKYNSFIKYITEYEDLLFSAQIEGRIQQDLQLGQTALKPILITIRKILKSLLRQKVLTCSQLKLLSTAAKAAATSSVTQKQVHFLKQIKINTFQLKTLFNQIRNEKTEWKFEIENFKNAEEFKKYSISRELNSVLRLTNTLQGVLENSVFKYGDVLKAIEFFEGYLEILRNMNMEGLSSYIPELLQKISTSNNIYESIVEWQSELTRAVEAFNALRNPFFSVEELKKILKCMDSPDPEKTLKGFYDKGDILVEMSAEITARFVRMYDAMRASIIKTFEKFNVSFSAVVGKLKKIEDTKKKLEEIEQYQQKLDN